MTTENKCIWNQQEGGEYETSCGDAFNLNDGTLKENKMKFCCYCGKEIFELLYKEEV